MTTVESSDGCSCLAGKMPLITEQQSFHFHPPKSKLLLSHSSRPLKQSKHSIYARAALMTTSSSRAKSGEAHNIYSDIDVPPTGSTASISPAPPPAITKAFDTSSLKTNNTDKKQLRNRSSAENESHESDTLDIKRHGIGSALTDTPLGSAPGSPKAGDAVASLSTASTPRIRPTTLDVPGLTRSKVSPDGKIAQEDVGSKLVIIMVGLPARGKSYITKKICRYLNWLQHDTKIFNVGERRRLAAGGKKRPSTKPEEQPEPSAGANKVTQILVNGERLPPTPPPLKLPDALQISNDADSAWDCTDTSDIDTPKNKSAKTSGNANPMEQSANFFDPDNKTAAKLREQVAKESLDELLDYILIEGGSIGIFDATNSTLSRRKAIMKHIRTRAGHELNVLFVESLCYDTALLESNMRLKLSGPDYKDKAPNIAYADFKKRVSLYEKHYVPIGEYEEQNNMPYIQMIDVGRKLVSHQIKGFLSSQAVYYLLNFNLAPRQIWITRHGESVDNVRGKIGGDSDLSGNGQKYAKALAKFVDAKRKEWEVRQVDKVANTHFPPHPGDHTPPNPHYIQDLPHRSFCVWTSMLKRSIQSAEFFSEEVYDVKQMRMLNELYAGSMEGLTYDEIKKKYPKEYSMRQMDKLHFRYPGPGGEGYLDVINRLRQVIVELERMQDHALLIVHRSIARVLLAYFCGLRREEVADLDVPLGMLYSLEPVGFSNLYSILVQHQRWLWVFKQVYRGC